MCLWNNGISIKRLFILNLVLSRRNVDSHSEQLCLTPWASALISVFAAAWITPIHYKVSNNRWLFSRWDPQQTCGAARNQLLVDRWCILYILGAKWVRKVAEQRWSRRWKCEVWRLPEQNAESIRAQHDFNMKRHESAIGSFTVRLQKLSDSLSGEFYRWRENTSNTTFSLDQRTRAGLSLHGSHGVFKDSLLVWTLHSSSKTFVDRRTLIQKWQK